MMRYNTFFSLTSGLRDTLYVPAGTIAKVESQMQETERVLGIERKTYQGVTRWRTWPHTPPGDLSDDDYCSTVEDHNSCVQWFYRVVAESSGKPATDETEPLTPERAETFWFALKCLEVPLDRWTADYYRARMEACYECLRGRGAEGMELIAEPLSEQQAGDVIAMFSRWLDRDDIRLRVIKGTDMLTDEYAWCSRCGAVEWDQINEGEDVCEQCKAKI